MHRTDALNNVAGLFTDDFEGTLEGTVVEQSWLNAVQEEIISVLTLAGIVPEKADHDQLANAIALLITASANDHANLTNPHSASALAIANRLALRGADGKLEGDILGNAATATKLSTPRTINGANFDGSANILINAVDATAREPAFAKSTAFNKNFGAVANTVCQGNDSRLSNARLASDVYPWAKAATNGFTELLSVNGWQKLPSGVIIQWGHYVLAVKQTLGDPNIVTLPTTFPTALLFAIVSANAANSAASPEMTDMDWTTPNKTTNTQLGVYSNYVGSARFFAIGF